MESSSPDAAYLQGVLAEVHGAIDRERGAVARLRELSTPRRMAVAIFAMAAIFIVPRAFVHLSAAQRAYSHDALLVAVAYLAFLFFLILAALRPVQKLEQRPLAITLALAALALPFVLANYGPGAEAAPLTRFGYCFFIGTAVGWVMIVLLRLLDRAAHDTSLGALTAVALATLAANFALHFDCPATDGLHRFTCHATVGVGLLIQYFVARRFLS
jgi:hypothetical protein